MPRGYRQSRRDANQTDLKNFAESIGMSVLEVHSVPGALDLLVGYCGVTIMVEVKDPLQPPSKRTLTIAEQKTFDTWRGRQCVIWQTEDDVSATRVELISFPLYGMK